MEVIYKTFKKLSLKRAMDLLAKRCLDDEMLEIECGRVTHFYIPY